MIKPIVRHGGGHAVTLSLELMQLAGIDPQGEVNLVIDGGKIVIAPLPKGSGNTIRVPEKLRVWGQA